MGAAALLSACSAPEADQALPSGVVELNDNGGWCWYQDERVVVDPVNGTMLVGSVATTEGAGGKSRGGDVEVVTYDFSSGATRRVTLDKMDGDAPAPNAFTRVFAAGSPWGGETMSHAWPTDFQVDARGRPYAIFSCRANDVPENTNYDDHRFFYARWDGAAWVVHPLAKAGALLFAREQDYTGLAALVPGDPDTVYVSTTIDPRDGSETDKHEIYEGVTADGGATWQWTAITSGSTADNLRPVVPIGAEQPLLWLRGTMPNVWDYELRVVAMMRSKRR